MYVENCEFRRNILFVCKSLRSDSGYFDTSSLSSTRQQPNESKGPMTLNSLPPLLINKSQKM